MSDPAPDPSRALLDALRGAEIEDALRWAVLRDEALRALDPNDRDALARAHDLDLEIAAAAAQCGRQLREELEAIHELRGRLSRRPRPRRGARFINRRA